MMLVKGSLAYPSPIVQIDRTGRIVIHINLITRSSWCSTSLHTGVRSTHTPVASKKINVHEELRRDCRR